MYKLDDIVYLICITLLSLPVSSGEDALQSSQEIGMNTDSDGDIIV